VIKVNLLREQAPRAKKAVAAVTPTVSRSGLVFVAIFVVLAGALGGAWYYYRHQIQVLTAQRNRLRIENARVQQWKKDIGEFEKLKQLLEKRVAVIEELKQSQTGPVRLLNTIIQSTPKDDSVWLTLLDQKPDRVQITGFILRNESLPDFMNNLMASGYFTSVDLDLFEAAKDKSSSKFVLTCKSPQRRTTE
jgi:Tfp pilus assembly protein PilN